MLWLNKPGTLLIIGRSSENLERQDFSYVLGKWEKDVSSALGSVLLLLVGRSSEILLCYVVRIETRDRRTFLLEVYSPKCLLKATQLTGSLILMKAVYLDISRNCCRLEIRKFMFSYRTFDRWNSVSDCLYLRGVNCIQNLHCGWTGIVNLTVICIVWWQRWKWTFQETV